MNHSRLRALLVRLALAVLLCSACGPVQPAATPIPPAQTPSPAAATPAVGSPPTTLPQAGGEIVCPGPQPPPVTDLSVYQTPPLPEPPARFPFRDPIFGTCLVRVTDRKTDLAEGDDSAGLKNEYSRVQAFNADGSRILVRGISATWYLYDALTLQQLRQLPFEGSVDPRWDAGNPDLLYYFDEVRLMACDVQSLEQMVIHDFAADFSGQSLSAVWTRYEGSASLDGRYWGLMAQDQDWQTVALLVYDQQQDQVIARRDIPPTDTIDAVTISPLGTYLLVYDEYCGQGQMGTEDASCGLMVYDRSLERGRGLLRIIGHSDLALDAQGREVLVYQDIDTDQISMLDLATGQVTALWPIDYSHSAIGLHFSGRAFGRPGWALVSTYNGSHPTNATWMDDHVFAVELQAGGRVVRLAHTHSIYDEEQEKDYWAEPHASVNPDFTRIVFTSNWGRSGTEEVEMYLIELAGGPDRSAAASPALAQPTSTMPPTSAVVPRANGTRTNLFFLHHSTGEGIIAEGNVRGYIDRYNQDHGTHYEFWDQGYNDDGLRDPQGEPAGTYNIPDDNTDPDGLYNLWTTDNRARRQILENHQVIAFKSCFPASGIVDDGMLAQYKQWYLAMRDVFDQYPDKVFVVMSPPPLHHLATEPGEARRARQFAKWLKSGEFLDGHPNVVCFDLFDALAHPDDGSAGANMLRNEYEVSHSDSDSHPNTMANQAVGPLLAQFLIDAAQRP
jgi:hypothetical protein